MAMLSSATIKAFSLVIVDNLLRAKRKMQSENDLLAAFGPATC
jgi:hypothetical protein